MTVLSAAPPAPWATAYQAFARVFPQLRVRLDGQVGRDWVAVSRLPASRALRARLIAAEQRGAERRYGRAPRPDVAAGFWLHRYAWPVCLLFTLPWLLQRRVPLLGPEQLACRHQPLGGPAELSLLESCSTGFACLSDDPAADSPGALVLPGQGALDATLRRVVAAQLGPLFRAFGPELRRGPRTLWGLATDELVEGLWFAAGLLGEEARAVAALSELLPAEPFTGAADFRADGTGLRRTRVSCCLFYTLRPDQPCAGCPRTCR
ncbi:iron-sulfur protein [Kitasatospora sp. RB6PN24]|uniref:iron-sulfur protein n=1 Tax=Kitasatospora humi TaxID=2893891 RepID=UPI001E448E11|nr:iron-sulfur protein [Kitasatospora humi]MCC9310452.1 iron-sulfur protein [Kitasatospora humi]